uniref:Inner membrane protein n=1 Tax=Parastrongyloides trichosuri TaxID=131310 RepID=A0A0N4Z288_PARTI
MGFTRYIIGSIFLAIAYNIHQNQIDWWIYTPVILSAGILSFLNCQTCAIGRMLSSITIVGGTIQVLFLTWIMFHFTKISSTNGSLKEFQELRYILVIASATCFMIYLRLSTSQSTGFFGLLRNLLLVSFSLILFPCVAVSLCIYNENLPYCDIIKELKF